MKREEEIEDNEEINNDINESNDLYKINDNIDNNSNEETINTINQSSSESQTSLQDSEPKSDDILPLNSAVIRRIRLNISTSLPSNKCNTSITSIKSIKEESMPSMPSLNALNVNHQQVVQQSVGSVLQNTMKQKLANVLHSDSQLSHEIKTSNQSSVIDISLLSENWSSLDCDYQQLIKTQKRNAKKPNIISLNSQLWNEFGIKMMALRDVFHQMNQTNQSQTKRSIQQSLKLNKKLKTLN